MLSGGLTKNLNIDFFSYLLLSFYKLTVYNMISKVQKNIELILLFEFRSSSPTQVMQKRYKNFNDLLHWILVIITDNRE
jgi:hypothetical protein